MKQKKFLKKAEYPLGKKSLQEFFKKNLKYPKQALLNKIEGIVYLKYEVNERGVVHNISLVQGIGYGCNEEAMRIVSMLIYPQVKNRGVKVNTKFKIRIHFKLPKSSSLKINYIYTKNKK